jgi:uncharacterized repeat protein (TIGR04076 family)
MVRPYDTIRKRKVMGKAKDPGKGNKIIGTIIDIKGEFSVGHEVGDRFELSCYNSDELCGFFHRFPFLLLSGMQYGGRYPWWNEGQTTFEYECPGRKNPVALKLEIVK